MLFLFYVFLSSFFFFWPQLMAPTMGHSFWPGIPFLQLLIKKNSKSAETSRNKYNEHPWTLCLDLSVVNVLPHLLYLDARTLFFWLNYVQVVTIMILQDNGNQAILYETILLSQTIVQFVQFQRYPSVLFLLFKSKIWPGITPVI